MQQLYVYTVMCPDPSGRTKMNKKGGATLSIRKEGGWETAFRQARQLAAWPDEPAANV